MLTNANFPIKQAWLLYSNVVNLTIEFSQKRDEQAPATARYGPSPTENLIAEILSLPEADYPLLQKAAAVQSKLPADAHFKYGLDIILRVEPT